MSHATNDSVPALTPADCIARLQAEVAALAARAGQAELERDEARTMLDLSLRAWDAPGGPREGASALIAENAVLLARATAAEERGAERQREVELQEAIASSNNDRANSAEARATAAEREAQMWEERYGYVIGAARSPCCSAAIRCSRCGGDTSYDLGAFRATTEDIRRDKAREDAISEQCIGCRPDTSLERGAPHTCAPARAALRATIDAEIAERGEQARASAGTFACPVCGRGTPHSVRDHERGGR